MNLDVNTLFTVTIYVEAILGLLLLFAWVQNTAIRAVAWWGFAHLIRAASVVLFGMYCTAPDLITIDLANALLFTAFAVTWTGARVFDGRPVEPVYLVTGAVLWLLVCRLPVLADAVDARALIASGIANHRAFLQDAALLAKRHSGNPRPTAVLLIDLDHFKSINDRFGHALGDRVLEIFTDAARQSIRSSDLIGRLGGEEFAAVLYDTSRDKAVAERIRESFAQVAQDVDGRPVCASVSIGIVHC